ncbi:MAG: DUF6516 family protein [Bacteroidales bacterium]|nr:DUF6516 family protein [Bacteroidales bacterium]
MSDLEILKWLENSKLVKSFEVVEFRHDLSARYLKLNIFLIDDSALYTKEYIDEKDRNYSFHWQNKNGELIIRWDNAPHHRALATYPHHLHLRKEENIKESTTISLHEVFSYIEMHIDSID